ncbi:hypothetical protein SCLCIDRAFT_830191 [Scleroderma citrinum Foug A]|uniref:CCHC-type domain-containing protein n=1 Tax=Scleroderma citrinum Foug A TaxID=1036808 RepID=A0A0C3E950_9AGAM|nr:hypothetical protein SCLCIDRAFT_830191 [Scleroderma citrinum Foug A]
MNKCGFFEWAEDEDCVRNDGRSPVVTVKRASETERPVTASNAPTRQCRCKEDAVQRTVTKDGLNKGRLFWGCAKGKDEGCGFFEWDDEPNRSTQSMSTYTASQNNASSSGRCFKCDQEGHWASACPTGGMSSRPRSHGASKSDTPAATCFKCGKPGHYSNACPTTQSLRSDSRATIPKKRATSSNDECLKCGQVGHWTSECPANGGPGPSKRSKGTKAPRSSRSGTKSTGTKKGKRDLKTKSGMFGAPDAF